MSAQKQQNLQDVFLNYVRKNKLPVTVFLMNGVKLQGVIRQLLDPAAPRWPLTTGL